MTYSNTAIVALLVHCIVNHNALRNKHFRNTTPAGKMYRRLMQSVAVFYIFDALWGILYDAHMIPAVFVDTVLYFVAMAATVFLWSRYVINYLQEEIRFCKVLKYIGWFFIAFISAALVINCFVPVMFWFDENGVYHAAYLRYAVLVLQVILFLVSACHVLVTAKGQEQRAKRRHRAIGAFGLTMTIMVIMQVAYPLLPMYSIGCLLGTCLLHSFVLEDLKDARRLELEEMARREEEHKQELGSARQLAYIDPLTGVKNKMAYAEFEKEINDAIKKNEQEPFAVAVCDINDLKEVNDMQGHKEGDICIRNVCARICGIYSHSPVFRVGGDEFMIFLSGEDYYRRNELMDKISAITKDPSKIKAGETLSVGMAEYDKNKHRSLLNVAEDADKAMYDRKQYLKKTILRRGDDTDRGTDPDYIPVIHARKRILIVDDIDSNREIMGDLLREDYDISYASDGIEAMNFLRDHRGEIDLVLLDLQMPNMDGREVIAQMQVDEDLMSIPVVFLTVDHDAELDCLRSGAMDFIPKPYPDIEIVKARVAKCIELAEDRELIHYTERDKLTGLLNKDYFFRYVNRLDHLYRETVLDAVACDVNKFHSINKHYGRKFGDQVLRCIGSGLRNLAREIGGISCREEDDAFLLYCPHQDDYERLISDFMSVVFADTDIGDKVSIRFGIYANAKQESKVEERFDRAKIAADRIKNDPEKAYDFYDI